MPGSFDNKLKEVENIYLHEESESETGCRTNMLMEGLFNSLSKLNQKVKTAKQAYDSGGLTGMVDATKSDLKKQWDNMTPQQQMAYVDDNNQPSFQKFKAYMDQMALDKATNDKAMAHYTDAWSQVPAESKRKYFNNSIQLYSRAAQAFQNLKKTNPNADWKDFLIQDWPSIRHQQSIAGQGQPFKRQLWVDLETSKQQSLMASGWDQQRWDSWVQATQ